jgi:hypothetical protein
VKFVHVSVGVPGTVASIFAITPVLLDVAPFASFAYPVTIAPFKSVVWV